MFIYPTWWSIIPLIIDRVNRRWVRLDDLSFVLRNGELSEQLQEEFPKHLIIINRLSWSIMDYHGILNLSRTINIYQFTNHPVYHLIDPHVMGLSCFFNVCQGWTQHGRRAGGTVLLNWASIPGKKWTFPSMHLDMYIYIYNYLFIIYIYIYIHMLNVFLDRS